MDEINVGSDEAGGAAPTRALVCSREPAHGADRALVAVKVVHTAAWFSIEACMVYVLGAGLTGRSDRHAAVAGAVVAGECLVFAANGFRCPLTDVAERLGAEHDAVTDIYLPRWFAHYLPAIHVPLIAVAVWLHARNIHGRRLCDPDAFGGGG